MWTRGVMLKLKTLSKYCPLHLFFTFSYLVKLIPEFDLIFGPSEFPWPEFSSGLCKSQQVSCGHIQTSVRLKCPWGRYWISASVVLCSWPPPLPPARLLKQLISPPATMLFTQIWSKRTKQVFVVVVVCVCVCVCVFGCYSCFLWQVWLETFLMGMLLKSNCGNKSCVLAWAMLLTLHLKYIHLSDPHCFPKGRELCESLTSQSFIIAPAVWLRRGCLKHLSSGRLFFYILWWTGVCSYCFPEQPGGFQRTINITYFVVCLSNIHRR